MEAYCPPPPRRIWPLIRERTKVGELITDRYTGGYIDRNLKFGLMELRYQDGRKYTSESPRRGATQDLLDTGETPQIVKKSGAWFGGGFRSYIDLELGKSIKVSRMISSLGGDSSSDDENPRSRPDKRRNKVRKLIPTNDTE